jgi:outer membrane protein assembly factor BamB
MLILLLSCAPKPPPRSVQAMEAPAPDAPPPTWAAPPETWGLHATDVQGPTGRIEVAWELHLESPVTSAPTATEDALYVHAGDKLVRLDRQGRIAWSVEVPGHAAPLYADNAVFVAHDHRMVSRSAVDGRALLDMDAFGEPRGTPLVRGDEIVWVTRSGRLVSSAGWFVEEALSASAGPSLDGERIWFPTDEGELVALEGRETAWVAPLGGPGAERVAFDGERLLVVTAPYGGERGSMRCHRAEDGELLWERLLILKAAGPPAWHPRAGWIVAEAAGIVYALDPETGSLNWSVELGEGLSTGPLVARERAWMGSPSGKVWQLDLDDGVVWGHVEVGSPVVGGLSVSEGLLTVGTADGRLLGLKAAP